MIFLIEPALRMDFHDLGESKFFTMRDGFVKCDFDSMLSPLNDVNYLKNLSMGGLGFESPFKVKS